MRVVAFVPDLMDRSRVAAAVPGVRFVADPGALGAEAADLALVDLGRPGALEAAAGLAAAGVRVVGFAAHVDADLLARAGEAGCAEALPRSVFFRRLASIVSGG